MTELKEALPKSGHVDEVCKKWLVREDGALAYQLQSQEINEFYRGNKFRNAVVRQDFPTALNEQIKEKEDAERQAALYYQMITEQEQADAQVARQLSQKMDDDVKKAQEESEISENIAKQLQSVYVETGIQVKNPIPLPARNPCTKNSSFTTTQQSHHSKRNKSNRLLHSPVEDSNLVDHLEQFHFTSNRNVEQHTPEKSPPLPPPPQHNNIFNHTPEKRIIPFDIETFKPNILPNRYPVETFSSSLHENITESYTDIADSIRQYDLSLSNSRHIDENNMKIIDQTDSYKKYKASYDDDLIRNNSNLQKLSPENYDYLMGNFIPQEELVRTIAGTSIATGKNIQLPEINPQHNDTLLVSNLDETVRIAALQELGLPTHEIKEIDRKIQQEKRDEELARRLQEQEQKASLTQEEKDRMLAIEAQDKELARMLQEREKAKAKRAREKARLKKQQKLEEQDLPRSALHYQPNYVALDHDSYSNPVDLVTSNSGCITGKKLSPNSEHKFTEIENQLDIKDDNIYTLPFDTEPKNINRPVVDKIRNIDVNIPVRPGKHIDKTENIATMIDPTYPSSGNTTMSSSASMSLLEESSSPVPPYMPIQGTRRNTSLEGKKKKSKDKCTHQ